MSTTEAQVAATGVASTGGEAAPEAPAAEAAAKSPDREYVVLRYAPGTTPTAGWILVGSIEASSAEQAIRRAVEQPGTSFLNPDGPTTLVAVPARSWNPTDVTVKTETSIVLS